MQRVLYQFHLLSDALRSGLTACVPCLVTSWTCLSLASLSNNLLNSLFPLSFFFFFLASLERMSLSLFFSTYCYHAAWSYCIVITYLWIFSLTRLYGPPPWLEPHLIFTASITVLSFIKCFDEWRNNISQHTVLSSRLCSNALQILTLILTTIIWSIIIISNLQIRINDSKEFT